MWALFSSRRREGFTLVELLIVIVVIAILAAITIVAYGGVTEKARVATLQSDLSQAKTFMESYLAENGQYPPDLATAESAGLKLSTPDSNVSYSVNNSASPATWGLTVTNGSDSYYINNTTAATATSGAWVTNLVLDPEPFVYNLTGYAWNSGRWFGGSPAAGTYSIVTNASDGPTASMKNYARKTWSTSPPSISSQGDSGFNIASGIKGISVAVGDSYTISAYLRPSSLKNAEISIYQYDSAGATVARIYGPVTVLPANKWTRISYTYTNTTSNVAYFQALPDISGSSSNGVSVWVPGDTLDGTGYMITKGTNLYDYSDPYTNSAWTWNGTANDSTSTGPAA